MSEHVQNLWRQLLETDVSQALFDRLREASVRRDLSLQERSELAYAAAKHMQTLAGDDSRFILATTREVLLPILFELSNDPQDDSKIESYRYRELLSSILDRLAPEEQQEVRRDVLGHIGDELFSQEDVKRRFAHSVVRAYGYRDHALFAKLLYECRNESVASDDCFTTAVVLRIPQKYREFVRPRLLKILTPQMLRERSYIFHEVIKQQWIDDEIVALILNAAADFPLEESDHWIGPSTALSVVGTLASHMSSDTVIQERCWKTVRVLRNRNPPIVDGALDITAGITSQIDSPSAIPDILNWLGASRGKSDRLSTLWRVYSRLAECVRPLQLLGWKSADANRGVWFDNLLADIRRDTGHFGRSSTIETSAKRDAWETACCLGLREIQILSEAIDHEQNPYVAHDIMKRLGCWPGIHLSAKVRNWIVTPFSLDENNENGEFLRRLGAVALARSAATWEAFHALLKVGLTASGSTLQSCSQALTSVAAELIKQPDNRDRVSSMLWSQAREGNSSNARAIAVRAITDLTAHKLLKPDCGDLVLIAQDESLPTYSRADAVEATRFVETDSAEALAAITALASQDVNHRLREAAADALATKGHLDALPDNRHESNFGLLRNEDGWTLRPEFVPTDRMAFTLAQMYAVQPDRAQGVAIALLQRVDEAGLYSVISSLGTLGLSTSLDISNAVVDRIFKTTTANHVELPLFRLLGRTAPQLLLDTPWELQFSNWIPDARAALANALHELGEIAVGRTQRLASLFGTLAGDGSFAVRRASYRAWAKLSPELFKLVVSGWADWDAPIDYRLRAAEAIPWWPSIDLIPDPITDSLLDPEHKVRDLAERVRGERANRLFAMQYVRELEDGLNNGLDVPQLYATGRALIWVGDDETKVQLEKLYSKSSLRPHQYCWLERVMSELDKRWRDVTLKWPEAWVEMEGSIEELSAIAQIHGKKYEVQATLWATHRYSPSGTSQWGGVLKAIGNSSRFDFFNWLGKTNEIVLTIPGRSDSRALLASTRDTLLIITGNGPYPGESKPLQ